MSLLIWSFVCCPSHSGLLCVVPLILVCCLLSLSFWSAVLSFWSLVFCPSSLLSASSVVPLVCSHSNSGLLSVVPLILVSCLLSLSFLSLVCCPFHSCLFAGIPFILVFVYPSQSGLLSVAPLSLVFSLFLSLWSLGLNKKIIVDKLKTVNYYALMNKLLEFMGHKLIQLEEKTLKYTAGEQFRLANSK